MKKLLVFFVTCLLCFSCKQEEVENMQDDPNLCIDCGGLVLAWDYPVKPGMKQWEKFKTNKEMVKACQIPNNVLSSLSTDDLTEICLRYPLINDIFAFNQLIDGLDKLFDDFNGIRELFKKEDVEYELLKRYQAKIHNLSLLDGAYSEIGKGYFIISISVLEALLSRCHSQDVQSKNIILQSLVAGYEGKIEYQDYFKGLGFNTNFFARAHTIVKISQQYLDEFTMGEMNPVFSNGWFDEETMDLVNKLSYQLIK